MTLCGLCHTDIHMRDDDWGFSNYPLVVGHEAFMNASFSCQKGVLTSSTLQGVGVVRKAGSDVRVLKIGDRVGISWIRDSCRFCDGRNLNHFVCNNSFIY